MNKKTDFKKKSDDGHEKYYKSGQEYLRQGDLKEAHRQFSMALEIKPDYANAYTGLGVVLQAPGKF